MLFYGVKADLQSFVLQFLGAAGNRPGQENSEPPASDLLMISQLCEVLLNEIIFK